MQPRNKLKITLLALLVLAGCAHKQPTSVSSMPRSSDPLVVSAFKKASDKLDKRQYREAAKDFDELMVQKPSSELDLVIVFNSAAAYEGLRECRRASRKYRQVIKLSRDRYQRLEAQAMYRLSFAYQCQGDHKKVLISLLDLQKHSKFLSFEVREAELPARLAIAYAMVGNVDLADKFYKISEQGLAAIQAQRKAPMIKRKALAKTLFYMGNIRPFDPKKTDIDKYLKITRSLQGYLLKSAEMDSEPWSKESAQQIVAAYDIAWDRIKKSKPKKGASLLQRRSFRSQQNVHIEQYLGNIERLRGQRFPEKKSPRNIVNLFADLQARHAQAKSYLAAHQLGTDVSPEEQKRRALRREGRTYKPNPKLERQTPKRSRSLPGKKKKKKQKSIGIDPNL